MEVNKEESKLKKVLAVNTDAIASVKESKAESSSDESLPDLETIVKNSSNVQIDLDAILDSIESYGENEIKKKTAAHIDNKQDGRLSQHCAASSSSGEKRTEAEYRSENEQTDGDEGFESDQEHGPNEANPEQIRNYLCIGKGSKVRKFKSKIEKIEELINELKAEADLIHVVFQNGTVDDINLVFAHQLIDFSKSLENHSKQIQEVGSQILDLEEVQVLTKSDTDKGNTSQSPDYLVDSSQDPQVKRRENKKKLYLKVLSQGHERVAKHLAKESCGVCFKKFSNRSSLRNHMGRHLGYSYKCKTCDKHVKSESALRVHQLGHEKGLFTCDDCGKQFDRKTSLKNHHETHREYKLSCPKPKCDRKFQHKHKLKEHVEQWHEKEKTVKCPECPKMYRTKNCMFNHKKRVHDQKDRKSKGKKSKKFKQFYSM